MDARPGRGGQGIASGLPDVGQGQDRRPAPTQRARGKREHHGPHPQDPDGARRGHPGPELAPLTDRAPPGASDHTPDACPGAASPQVPVRSSNATPPSSRHTPAGTPSSSAPPMTPSQSGPAPRLGAAPAHTMPSASSTSSRPLADTPLPSTLPDTQLKNLSRLICPEPGQGIDGRAPSAYTSFTVTSDLACAQAYALSPCDLRHKWRARRSGVVNRTKGETP